MNIGTLDPNETAKRNPNETAPGEYWELEKVNHDTICCFVGDTLRDYTLMDTVQLPTAGPDREVRDQFGQRF